MTKEEELYIEIGNSLDNTQQSQMFGKPCLKVNKKAFVSFFENEMVFKLDGDVHNDALSLDGSKLFDPSKKNRPMKAWIQVPFCYSDKWSEYALAAKIYVEKMTK